MKFHQFLKTLKDSSLRQWFHRGIYR